MITIAGSLVMDLTLRVPHLVQPGGATHGDNLQVACGGRGANQACAVARMSAQPNAAALVGVVGRDLFGDAMLAAMAVEGVDTRAVTRRADGASGCFIVAADPHGQTQTLVHNGINGTLSASEVEQQAGLIRSSQAVITQLEISLEAAEAALRIGRQAGVRTFLNAAPTFRFHTSLLPLCDMVTLNEREASEIGGQDVNDLQSAARVAAILCEQGARAVLVTLGADGVWVDIPEWKGHLPGYSVKAVDTLGAGDTFIAALTVRLCEGAGFLTAAQFALAASAISVTRRGAQPAIPWRNEVEEFLALDTKQADAP